MAGELAPLTNFNGIPIHVGVDELVSLNDMWVAAGRPANQDPRQWSRLPSTVRYVEHLRRKDNVGKSHIIRAERGRAGGTWGHWKLAIDYAAYLCQPLKDHVYEVFRERIEEDADPELGFERWRERAERRYTREGHTREWIAARLRSILIRNLETDVLKAHGITESKDYARLTNETYLGLFGGPAKKLKEQKGVPEKANLRDHLDEIELLSVSMAETLARHKIERGNLQGVGACAVACRSSASNVATAVRTDLGDARDS